METCLLAGGQIPTPPHMPRPILPLHSGRLVRSLLVSRRCVRTCRRRRSNEHGDGCREKEPLAFIRSLRGSRPE